MNKKSKQKASYARNMVSTEPSTPLNDHRGTPQPLGQKHDLLHQWLQPLLVSTLATIIGIAATFGINMLIDRNKESKRVQQIILSDVRFLVQVKERMESRRDYFTQMDSLCHLVSDCYQRTHSLDSLPDSTVIRFYNKLLYERFVENLDQNLLSSDNKGLIQKYCGMSMLQFFSTASSWYKMYSAFEEKILICQEQLHDSLICKTRIARYVRMEDCRSQSREIIEMPVFSLYMNELFMCSKVHCQECINGMENVLQEGMQYVDETGIFSQPFEKILMDEE